MKKIFLLFWMLCAITCFAQQPNATIKEYKKLFPTYPFSDPNPIPLLTPVYPYFRFDGFSNTSVQKEWKVIELENVYLKLLILPEIGGKIWTAIEKSTNRPFIYYNHSIKFRDIAMRGPWTSGGLEANFGIIGHTPNCSTPVDYTTTNNPDGSVSCTIGALDLLSRSYWRMEINLPKDKAYFTTRTFWYNATGIEQPYYHWMNAGLKANGNLEFIYPGTKYIGHEGENANWPVNRTNAKNIAFYNENNFGGYKSYHVFGRYTNFTGAYWHDDDFGMVRFGNHDDKAGKKIWIWGLSGQGMIWEKLLTDTDGQYIELQSGRRFNQNAALSSLTPFKQTAFAPYGTDSWKEYWYPVLATKGFVEANEYGALNLKMENGWMKIYFSPVQAIQDQLVINAGERVIYSKPLHLHVLQLFKDSIPTDANTENLMAVLGNNKLIYKSNPNNTVLNRPVETPAGFNWQTAYGLYLLGKDAMEGKTYAIAEEKLQASLQIEPHFLPALVAMSELLYRNMRYTEALTFVRTALSIDTYDGAANYYYGLINTALGNSTNAKDGFDIATLSVQYRSAAYTELARIYLKEKELDKSLDYTKKAIDFNRFNIEALQMQAVLYRYLQNEHKAKEVLQIISAMDLLSHFARFEKYLWYNKPEDKKQFLALIRNELPQETLLELAIWYYNTGDVEEAEKLFSFNTSNAEAHYWLSYLHQQPVDFSQIHPDLSFPFRSETAHVIEQLLQKQNNWLLKYQLALIYKDRNRMEESKTLLSACGNEPNYAPFYAVRAAIFKNENHNQEIADLKKALAIDTQWRYPKLISEYYIEQQQYDSALYYAGNFYMGHPENYIMGMLYAKTLLLNKKYPETDTVLSHLNIIPFEGAIEGRELYRETKLMQAVMQIEQGNYEKSLVFVNASKEWPEHLGVGKPYDEDIDLRLEYWISYLCFQHQKNVTAAHDALEKIIAFQPKIENTVKNFIPANALVSAWAYEQLNQKAAGINWLNNQIQLFPANKELLWSKSVFMKENKITLTALEKDANTRILERLINSK